MYHSLHKIGKPPKAEYYTATCSACQVYGWYKLMRQEQCFEVSNKPFIKIGGTI